MLLPDWNHASPLPAISDKFHRTGKRRRRSGSKGRTNVGRGQQNIRADSESRCPTTRRRIPLPPPRDRWEWSDTAAHTHGYDPDTAAPTTELLVSQKHPDDRAHVAHTLHTIRTAGGAFSSRHRIIDTHGHTRSVVVGDRVLDEHGEIIGSSGFYIDITDTIDSTVADLTASRGAIEQAKGMLMLIYLIPADRAFDVPPAVRTRFDYLLLHTT